MDNDTTKTYLINEIMADLGFYIEPTLLKEEYSKFLDVKLANIKEIKKYQGLLSNINYAWQKVLKYEKYFEVFYVPSEIENFEALNHHLHAYLQDIDTLRNKIKVFFDYLKKDLKGVASNKEEVIAFIDAGIEKTYEVFEGILKYRHPHVHDGMRFMDGDLLKAENAHNTLQMILNPIFSDMLNLKNKQEFIEKFEKEKIESFEVARDHWVDMTKKNNPQITGYLMSVLEIVRPNLYQFLNVKSVKEAMEESKKHEN